MSLFLNKKGGNFAIINSLILKKKLNKRKKIKHENIKARKIQGNCTNQMVQSYLSRQG